MKKVIDGSLYNTESARKICERLYEGPDHHKGAIVKEQRALYKTRSDKYFYYIYIEFRGHVDINNDDLDPIYEEMDLVDKKIIPVPYESALRFASEVYTDSDEKHEISKFFPELADHTNSGQMKFQKKIYLSEKADWYLSMILQEVPGTNSSLIEDLIVKEYRELYSKGVVNRDPFFEMEE